MRLALDPPDFLRIKKKDSHCRSRVSRVERQQSNTAVLPNHCWLALPYSWSSGIVFVMKLEKLVTRAYTPGLFRWAQPSPKLTTPACTQVPFTIGQMRGPPESPWADHTFRHTFSIHHWEVSKCSESRAPTVSFSCSFAYARCAWSKYKEAQWADSTVPGRSPCRPPGIQRRACLAGCPPCLFGLFGTTADMNSGQWLALGLPVIVLLLAKALVEYKAKHTKTLQYLLIYWFGLVWYF